MKTCPYGKISVDRTKDKNEITFEAIIGRKTNNPLVFNISEELPVSLYKQAFGISLQRLI